MITQKDDFVNEKIDKFKLHKDFACEIQTALANLYKSKTTHNLTRKGQSVLECGTSLEFQHYFNAEDTRTLNSANFCKHKLCPMCAWRWHLKQSVIIQRAFDNLGKQDFYHLVLTIPNIKFMTKDFLSKLREKAGLFMQKVAKSIDYLISFEITIDSEGNYHPHYHILYINHLDKPLTRKTIQTEWAKIANTGTNYAIAKQTKCTGDKIALELTKYILKFEDLHPTETQLRVIDMATHGLRKITARGAILEAKLEAEKQIDKEQFDIMKDLEQYDSEIEWYKWLEDCYVLQEGQTRKRKAKV